MSLKIPSGGRVQAPTTPPSTGGANQSAGAATETKQAATADAQKDQFEEANKSIFHHHDHDQPPQPPKPKTDPKDDGV